MSDVRFSLGELSEFLDDTDGHRLAQFLQKKSGAVPTCRRVFDYQPPNFSLNVIALPIPSPTEPEEKDQHANPESDQVQSPKLEEADLNATIRNEADLAAVENVQPVQTQAPPLNSPVAAPRPRLRPRVTLSLQKSPVPTALTPKRLQHSASTNADKLRRQTLTRLSSLGGGRRTLLTEFENTMCTPDFLPNTCSTPIQVQPSESPKTPTRSEIADKTQRGAVEVPAGAAENVTGANLHLPPSPEESRLHQVLSLLEATLDKIAHEKENEVLNVNAPNTPIHSSRTCSQFASPEEHHKPTRTSMRPAPIKDDTKAAKELPNTQELLNEAHKLLRTMRDSQQFQVPKIVIPINQTINGATMNESKRNQPLKSGENTLQQNKLHHNVQNKINSNNNSKPEIIQNDAHKELQASLQSKCLHQTQSVEQNNSNEDTLQQNKSQLTATNRTYDLTKNDTYRKARLELKIDAIVQNKSQQTTFVEKGNCIIPKQQNTVSLQTENCSAVNDCIELRVSDVITEIESTGNELNIESGILNLATRAQQRGKCHRPRKLAAARKRAESPPMSTDTDTEIESHLPQTQPLNMHNARNEYMKNPKMKRPLNKEPCTPKNGETFAKELKEHFARLSNMDILDMRKRNSMGEFFPKSKTRSSGRGCEDINVKRQLLLEEELKLEILRRKLDGRANNDFNEIYQLENEEGAVDAGTLQHDKYEEVLQAPDNFKDNDDTTTFVKPRIPQEDIVIQIIDRTLLNSSLADEQNCDLVSFNNLNSQNSPIEQYSRYKTRSNSKRKKNTPEVVKNYLEVRKQYSKRKSLRKSDRLKRSLYSGVSPLLKKKLPENDATINEQNDDKLATQSPTILRPPTPFSSPPPALSSPPPTSFLPPPVSSSPPPTSSSPPPRMFIASPGQSSQPIQTIRIASPPSPMVPSLAETVEQEEIYLPPEAFVNMSKDKRRTEPSKPDEDVVFKKPLLPAPQRKKRTKSALMHLTSSNTNELDISEASNLRRSKRGQVPLRTSWSYTGAGSENLLADMFGRILEAPRLSKNNSKSRIHRSSVSSNYNWPRIASSTTNSSIMHDVGDTRTKSHRKSKKLSKQQKEDSFSGLGDTDITSSSAANSPTLRSSKIGVDTSQKLSRKTQPLSAILETPTESDSNLEIESAAIKQKKSGRTKRKKEDTEAGTAIKEQINKENSKKSVMENNQSFRKNDELFDQLKQLEAHENVEVLSASKQTPLSLPEENTAKQSDAQIRDTDNNIEVEIGKQQKRAKQRKRGRPKTRGNNRRVVRNISQAFEPPIPEPEVEMRTQLVCENDDPQEQQEPNDSREILPAMPTSSKFPEESIAAQSDAGTSKSNTHKNKMNSSNRGILNHSRVYVPSATPMRQMNAMFEQLKSQATNQECGAPKSTTTQDNMTCTKKLRVRLPRARSTEESVNTTSATTSESHNELLTWLKGVAQIKSADQNAPQVFMDMRCSIAGELCFVDLEGIDYAFYDTKNKASLGYLRFKPLQKKPEKRTNKFHLHFVVLAGKFDFGTDREHGTFSVGDMIAINKGCRYTIENKLDDVGILMVIKK